MIKSTQKNNIIRIDTPLGKDILHLTRLEVTEGISEPFFVRAYVYTNGTSIDPNELIGKPVLFTVLFNINESTDSKFFHGYVCSLRSNGSRLPSSSDGEMYQDYVIDVCSSLDFAYQRINCKVFQNLDVREIVQEVLSEHDVSLKIELKRSYPKYEYKVQYNETDFDFVHRLLEEEGIFYYFKHSQSSHSMILCDDITCYKPCIESSVEYKTGSTTKAHIHRWTSGLEISPGKVVKKGYDFLTPAAHPTGYQKETSLAKQQLSSEVYQYQAGSELNSRIQDSSAFTLEALQRDTELCSGASNCRTFSAGSYFTFQSHEDKRFQGKSYLITKNYLEISISSQTGASKSINQSVHNQFSCVPKATLYRPKPVTSKPRVYGVQTATVTGEKQDEIHVDKYGRVKVLFHWDRIGPSDNTSSCWIRVAQSWAGSGWGSSFLPRVGHEVLVEFLDGDPDQPIVVGSLYNGQNLPPYNFPEDKTISGIRTRSVKKGDRSSFNEIKFDDKKDNELLYIHAEKNHHVFVENDQNSQIKNNSILKVDNTSKEIVGNDKHENISNNLNIEVGSKIQIKCGGASIQLSSDGNIDIKGSNIKINGATISLKGGVIKLN